MHHQRPVPSRELWVLGCGIPLCVWGALSKSFSEILFGGQIPVHSVDPRVQAEKSGQSPNPRSLEPRLSHLYSSSFRVTSICPQMSFTPKLMPSSGAIPESLRGTPGRVITWTPPSLPAANQAFSVSSLNFHSFPEKRPRFIVGEIKAERGCAGGPLLGCGTADSCPCLLAVPGSPQLLECSVFGRKHSRLLKCPSERSSFPVTGWESSPPASSLIARFVCRVC